MSVSNKEKSQLNITAINSIEELTEYRLNKPLNGLYTMPDEVYFDPRCPGVTRSRLNGMRISPRYYKIMEIEDNSKNETEALRFGKMFHLAMEDFDRFNRVYHVVPEFKGPKGGELKGKKLLEATMKWEADNQCKAITHNEKSRITLMKDMVKNNHEYKDLFKDPLREIVVFATEPQYGTLLKGKCDILQFDNDQVLIGDFKTCEPESIASHHSILRTILNDNYRLYYQYSFYCYILNLLNYDSDFRFIFVEKDLPFGVRIVSLTNDFYEYGLRQIFSDIEKLHECKKYDFWPDYETLVELNLPNYLKGDIS